MLTRIDGFTLVNSTDPIDQEVSSDRILNSLRESKVNDEPEIQSYIDDGGADDVIDTINVSDVHRHDGKTKIKKRKHQHKHHHWWKGILGALWGAGLLTLSVLSLNIPMIAYYCVIGATTLVTLYLGSEAYISGTKKLFETKKLSMNTLYMISTLTIIGVSIASIFIPGLPMMFEAAPLVLGFWHIGEAIEHSLKKKVVSNLKMCDSAPKKVTLKGDSIKSVSVKSLVPNDVIIIHRGEVIPVDGICLNKTTSLFTTKINGSPFSSEFKYGASVLAGMRLADDIESFEMRVTRTFKRSYLSRVDANIKQASSEKAPIEIVTDKILQYFIPALVGVALISGIVIGIAFNPALAIQCVVSVLVSACPCALSLVTPLAVKIGMSKAAEHGVNFKNGKTLQAAADIDIVVFDLNGTLTKGEPEAKLYHKSNTDFLQHFALLESHSTHPIAKAICDFVKTQRLSSLKPLNISHIDKSNHAGIKAMIDGEVFMVGNSQMLAANGIKTINTPYSNPDNGSIYLVRGEQVIGQMSVFDPLRDHAKETIKALHTLGKEVHICTGADMPTARKYAELLGIPKENVCANCVGADGYTGQMAKIHYIDTLRARGRKVAMVGDAANDATAMTRCDFGIAVKSSVGDEITQQQAGAVVQNGSLLPIVAAFDIAKKTKRNIWQNLIVSLTYNSTITLVAAGLFIALGFALNPAIGIALMVLETTIVLSNAYRFKNQEVISVPLESNPQVREPAFKTTTTHVLGGFGHRLEQQKELVCSPAESKETHQHKKARFFECVSTHQHEHEHDECGGGLSPSPSSPSCSDCE